jgi:PAN-like domain
VLSFPYLPVAIGRELMRIDAADVIRKFASKSGDSTSCRDTCLADTSCISFSFDSAKTQCAMYSDTLVNQGFRKSSTSTVTYWNHRCFIETCTTDSTITTSSSQTTTTTTDSGNPGDPSATPADPSAFTATYTYTDGLLPVFTDPVPSLAGLSQETPVPVCVTDPTNANVKVEIFNGTGGALVYQATIPPRIGLLRLNQMPQSAAGIKAYQYPQFHFERPAKAPAG